MTFKETKELIKEDYARITQSKSPLTFIFKLMVSDSFRITFWFRIGTYLKTKNNLLAKIVLIFTSFLYRCYEHHLGIQLPFMAKIEGGLNFQHYNCVVFAQSVVIGKNCTIHQGVIIGRVFNGKKAGVPRIGNNCVIFPGAKIIGNITIGDYVVIGANAVVTDSMPDFSIVAGIPAKVISEDSTKCFDEEWSKLFMFNNILKRTKNQSITPPSPTHTAIDHVVYDKD